MPSTANREDRRDIYELSIKNKHFQIAEYLLLTGYTPKKDALLNVASRCNTKLNDLLIAKGADIKAVNEKGESALHISAKENCFGAVVSFVELGADLELKDKQGKKAFDYISSQKTEISYYLSKKNRSPASNKP